MAPREEFTNAVIDLLARGTGKLVGDAKAPPLPPGMPERDFWPYCIVYSIPGGSSSGSLADPFEDSGLVYQVTSVGRTRQQAEWMADRVRNVWLSRTTRGTFQVPLVSPQGWTAAGRIPQDGSGGGVDREGEPPNEVFSVPDRYILQVTPGVLSG